MNIELPWVEKYRPKVLNDVVGQEVATSRLKAYAKAHTLPHMLFSGPAGIGKTTCALALSNQLFGKEGITQNFLELNASDSRGIDVVRETIKNFARTLAFNADFKIIFLDEADALTPDAQHALRRTMEKYTPTSRFILSANYSSKIIEPLQSRCVVFRFTPLKEEEVTGLLEKIAKAEKLSLTKDGTQAIAYVSEGDLRKAINVLQGAAATGKKIDADAVYTVSSRARPAEVREMIEHALKGDFLKAREKLDFLMYQQGMSGEDVITQLYREVIALNEKALPDAAKVALVDKIGEYNFRMVEGANERIQLEALLAQFMGAGKKR